MSALATTREEMDARARTQFSLALAECGIDPKVITDVERRLWLAAYKMGYSTGAKDASAHALEMLKEVVK